MASANTPAFLCKYFPPERLDCIENRELAFSPLSTFNDPFEGKPDVHGLSSEEFLLEKIQEKFPGVLQDKYNSLPEDRRSSMSFDEFKARMLNISKRELPKQVAGFHETLTAAAKLLPDRMTAQMGAMCLCETRDSLLMWAHYARSHTGFVVEFDTSSPFFSRPRTDSDEHYQLRRVLYRSRRPSGHIIDFDGSELFLVKSDDWSYEKEWRIFAPLNDADRKIEVDGTMIHLFNFPIASIKSITIGARASEHVRSRICAIASGPGDHRFPVYQSTPSKSHFMLEFERLAI